jgi:hypothetical protein
LYNFLFSQKISVSADRGDCGDVGMWMVEQLFVSEEFAVLTERSTSQVLCLRSESICFLE